MSSPSDNDEHEAEVQERVEEQEAQSREGVLEGEAVEDPGDKVTWPEAIGQAIGAQPDLSDDDKRQIHNAHVKGEAEGYAALPGKRLAEEEAEAEDDS